MIPVVPFRAAQHDVGNLDNLQIWADIAVSRLPYTRLYGAMYIDEFSIDALMRGNDRHNWWAWQLGMLTADMWGLAPNVDLRLEYTRSNPWAYRHRYPWNSYDTWAMRGNEPGVAYPLGFWQGHNGDYVRGDVYWRPKRDVGLSLWLSQARRGGEGSVAEQYDQIDEPYLFGPVTRTREFGAEASWEIWRDLALRGSMSRTARRRTDSDTPAAERSWTTLSAGLFYNVW